MADVPALNRRMTSLDASFLYLEQPNTPLHVAGIYTVARPLDHERLIADVQARLPLIPRYTQRAVMVPLNLGHPTWEPDPEFDICRHMLHHRLRGKDAGALAALCAKLFAQPLDRSRPLWEMHVIEPFGTGCALFAKTHHAMVDGASGVQLINLLMDATPHPRPSAASGAVTSDHQDSPGALTLAAAGLLDTARTQLRISQQIASTLLQPSRAVQEVRSTLNALSTLARTLLSPPPRTPFNGPISTQRALAWASLSLHEVKAVKSRLGGTVNDVVLAVISGTLRHYLRELGMPTERTELKAIVPVNVRGQHEHLKLGNRVSMMVAPLPIGITDPVERLRQVSAAMDLLKSNGQAAQMERIVALTDLLPPPLQRPLAQLQASVAPVNTVCTNVPGPRETRYLLGEPVQLMVPLVPLAAGIGLGFAIMSYADQLTIGINADAQRVPEAWTLAAAIHESFEELWGATGLERVARAGTHSNRSAQRPRRARQTPKATRSAPAEAEDVTVVGVRA